VGARIAVGVSEEVDPVEAFGAAAAAAARGLDGAACDLCLVFASAQHLGHAKWILSGVHEALDPARLLGCGAGGVVGAGREIEEGPGAVVWAASLPGARIDTHRLEVVQTEEVESADDGRELRGLDSESVGETMIVLADPYTFAVELLLKHLNQAHPGMPVLGGLASASAAGSASLMVDGAVADAGAVACSISGTSIVPCVSQGATPVGPEMTITGAEGNVISELASKPAIARLREAIGELEPDEQALAAQGLMLGIVIDENQPDYGRGDFLVRPIIGSDPAANTIAVGERVRLGQTVRMHVRDGASADEDLREALRAQSLALGSAGAAGALLFTCNGRGSHMFDVPDHDAGAIEDALAVPTAGFFCAGEIGPVGGRNFLHGFTATLAVFAGE
jgi:small ligand-binding sensory domain FIST